MDNSIFNTNGQSCAKQLMSLDSDDVYRLLQIQRSALQAGYNLWQWQRHRGDAALPNALMAEVQVRELIDMVQKAALKLQYLPPLDWNAIINALEDTGQFKPATLSVLADHALNSLLATLGQTSCI